LVLTPIVFTVVSQLKLNPLPYVFTCAFIANTASLLLPTSNPVNLLPYTAFHLTLGNYSSYLLLPSVVAIAVNVFIFSLSVVVKGLENSGAIAAILGADLGPNLTIAGSLSSLLWLAILRQRGLDLSPWQYFKVGLALTLPMLAGGIGSLCVMSQFSGG
jgi:Na+/H+ antiporter NhaD/arsenite permease-like protein